MCIQFKISLGGLSSFFVKYTKNQPFVSLLNRERGMVVAVLHSWQTLNLKTHGLTKQH
jgi:hypothetical protein